MVASRNEGEIFCIVSVSMQTLEPVSPLVQWHWSNHLLSNLMRGPHPLMVLPNVHNALDMDFDCECGFVDPHFLSLCRSARIDANAVGMVPRRKTHDEMKPTSATESAPDVWYPSYLSQGDFRGRVNRSTTATTQTTQTCTTGTMIICWNQQEPSRLRVSGSCLFEFPLGGRVIRRRNSAPSRSESTGKARRKW